MKYNFSFLLIPFLLLVAGCQPTETPFTDADKAEVEAAALAVFNNWVDGASDQDADTIIASYASSNELRWVNAGVVTSGWTDFEAIVTDGFWSSPAAASWSLELDEVIVDVLSRDIAIVTAHGTMEYLDENGELIDRVYAVTDVVQRFEDGWTIVNEHESFADPETSEDDA